jgi:hypothetical protein
MKISEILKEGDVIPFKKPDSDLKNLLILGRKIEINKGLEI